MKLYCYHLAPIDFWYGVLTGEELLLTVHGRDGRIPNFGQTARVCQVIDSLVTTAEEVFRQIGWECDVREGPFFFAVPGEPEMRLGYLLKQDNNGSCFVASPIELDEEMLSIIDKRVLDTD